MNTFDESIDRQKIDNHKRNKDEKVNERRGEERREEKRREEKEEEIRLAGDSSVIPYACMSVTHGNLLIFG